MDELPKKSDRMAALAELALNAFMHIYWSDDILLMLLNAFFTLFFIIVGGVWPLVELPRYFRLLKLEARRSFRRKLLGRLFDAAPECREQLVHYLLVNMGREAYPEARGNPLSGFRSKFYRYVHHYEIYALQELAEAKDLNRKLLFLAFIDATRLGSHNCPELHQHLTSILSAWDSLYSDSDSDSSSPSNLKTMSQKIKYGVENGWFNEHEEPREEQSPEEKFTLELDLIKRGEEGRKNAFMEERSLFWSLAAPHFVTDRGSRLDNVDGKSQEDLGRENLDFVEFGPSIGSMRKVVKSANSRRWAGCNPRGEYICRCVHYIVWGAHLWAKLDVLFAAFKGCYPLTTGAPAHCYSSEQVLFNTTITWLDSWRLT